MWSLSFPAPLKEYIDCIVELDKTMSITEKKGKGLSRPEERKMVYVQSSGGAVGF